MPFCPDCASPIEAGQPACPRCGRQLSVAPAVSAPAIPIPVPVAVPARPSAKWAAILILISCAISLISLARFLFVGTISGLGAVAVGVSSILLWLVWLILALFIWRGQPWARWAALVLVLWNGLTLALSLSHIRDPFSFTFLVAFFIPILRIIAIAVAFL